MPRIGCRGRHGLLVLGFLTLLAAMLRPDPGRAQNDLPVVRLQLQWVHQAQFAGYYVAHALGLYEREGIAVEFIQGGPPIPGAPALDPLQMLSHGAADVSVAWLSNALAFRAGGGDAVNFAQVFKGSATLLVCRRSAGVRRAADVRGRTIGVWNVGDQQAVRYWLSRRNLSDQDVKLVPQESEGRDLLSGRVACATVMAYDEYLTLLQKGLTPLDLLIIRLGEEGSAFLEDGLYATKATLTDPAWQDRLARFLRATAAGWRYAQQNPEEALAITLTWAPLADRAHQRRMLESVVALVHPSQRFGLLELPAFERSVHVIGRGMGNPVGAAAAAQGSWTHRIWIDAGLDEERGRALVPAVRHYLVQVVGSGWFYALGLIGTVGFALSGLMQALQRRYNLWGAFILALLLAAGGGTMRDLLVGGDRLPPFIFTDPNYIMIVFAVVLVGAGTARFLSEQAPQSRAFDRTMVLADTIGFATFAVVGAQVALMAGLGWYWIPFCAGLSCAGGGMLLDIVTGREPRTFQGELYEEIAAAGGLILFAALLVANGHESVEWLVPGAVIATWLLVFGTRLAVVRYGIRSYRFGAAAAPADSSPGGAAAAPAGPMPIGERRPLARAISA